MSFLNLQIVSWSRTQCALHSESIEEMLRNNRRVFRGETTSDYIPIGVFKSDEEARQFVAKACRIREAREGTGGRIHECCGDCKKLSEGGY